MASSGTGWDSFNLRVSPQPFPLLIYNRVSIKLSLLTHNFTLLVSRGVTATDSSKRIVVLVVLLLLLLELLLLVLEFLFL